MLKLDKITAYKLSADDDNGRYTTRGYFQDSNVAYIKSKGIGSWGSSGRVESVQVYIDDEGQLYEVTPLGKFKDVEDAYKKEVLDSIKSKLNKQELEFLKLNDGLHNDNK